MGGPFADRLFRIAFVLAGAYNLAFGVWAGIWPLALFDLFDITPPRYPGIWACLGMVVGVYGLLYWHAAWRLDTAWPIIAVGLLGKVLGPIGMAMSLNDDWPRRLAMICIYNDVIWWLPFGAFLVRGTAFGQRLARSAPWLCAALHTAALATLATWLRPGTLVEPSATARAAYIAEHTAVWSLGWALWMLAATSVVGFYAWWGSHLATADAPSPDAAGATDRRRSTSAWRATLATASVLIAAAGLVCDFTGEGLAALRLVELAAADDVAAYVRLERTITLMTAGAANGLYTLAGVLLMLATPGLPAPVRAAMGGTWLAGAAMSVAAALDHAGAMVAATAVLFPLLIGWIAWMGARWRTR